MANGKTPGSDGLPKEFYVTFWDQVGHDRLGVFCCAFNHNILGDSQRLGVITLLCPSHISSDYRKDVFSMLKRAKILENHRVTHRYSADIGG